ncbi:SMI1/KNR4 family protein [Spirillospora sp. NPDC050679]
MMSEFKRSWEEIEAWLQRHAPASFACLKSGASEAELADFEALLGFPLPEPLRWLWMRHDGVESAELPCSEADPTLFLPDFDGLLSVEAATGLHEFLHPHNILRSWIPFTAFSPDDPFCGAFLDAETGLIGGWQTEDVAEINGTRSIDAYFAEIAVSLRHGLPFGEQLPGVADGCLSWEHPGDVQTEGWEPWRPQF